MSDKELEPLADIGLYISSVKNYYKSRDIVGQAQTWGIHSRFSRHVTARGRCTGLVTVGPTKKCFLLNVIIKILRTYNKTAITTINCLLPTYL